MRKRVTTPATTPAPTSAPDAPVPAGYAILAIGDRWQPVRVKRPGEYVELVNERTGQRGPYATRGEALAIIAANPDWRKRQAEIRRGRMAAQAVEAPAVAKKGRSHARR